MISTTGGRFNNIPFVTLVNFFNTYYHFTNAKITCFTKNKYLYL